MPGLGDIPLPQPYELNRAGPSYNQAFMAQGLGSLLSGITKGVEMAHDWSSAEKKHQDDVDLRNELYRQKGINEQDLERHRVAQEKEADARNAAVLEAIRNRLGGGNSSDEKKAADAARAHQAQAAADKANWFMNMVSGSGQGGAPAIGAQVPTMLQPPPQQQVDPLAAFRAKHLK